MDKKKYSGHILLLGGGLMQEPAVKAARELNLHITLVDGNPHAMCAPLADAFYPIDLKDTESLVALAKKMRSEEGIDGVFTAGTDFSASVAKVAEELNLPGHSYQAALNASNKTKMRQCFKNAGLPSPDFFAITNENCDKEISQCKNFPLVVKPADNMGGRGCKLVYTKEELKEAVRDAIKYSRTQTAIVEDYMDGREFSLDAIVYNGTVTITGFADRHVDYPPYFIEMGHTMPTSASPSEQAEIIDVFIKGIKALGLTCGAAKGDMKLTKKGAMIGEIAARLSGGYMSGWTYPYASDVFLTKELMRLSVGLEPDFSEYNKTFPCYSIECKRTSSERAYISIPGQVKNIYGIDEAKKIKNVMKVFERAKISDLTVFPTNNVEKCGNIISKAASRKNALKATEKAVSSITIRLCKNNEETEKFLNQSLETSYPPSAFKVTEKEFSKLLQELPESFYSDKIRLPGFAKNLFKKQKDFNGKCLTLTLNQFKAFVKNEKKVQLNTKKFLRALVRGGLQGILYYFDCQCDKTENPSF